MLAVAGGVLGSPTLANSDSQERHLCEGYLPANDLVIPARPDFVFFDAGGTVATGITETEFNEVLDKIEKVYAPIIAKAGGNLKVERMWENGTVNAFATVDGDDWIVRFPGGIPRLAGMNKDAFMGVACHEVGHHLGGAPLVFGTLTNEGGADYFSALKCLRLIYADEDNEAALDATHVDSVAKEKCAAQHSVVADQLVCQRTSQVAMTLGKVLSGFEKAVEPRFDTPDATVVTVVRDRHPAAQCRVDTLFAGSICQVASDIPMSRLDHREGSCVEGTHALGLRPKCWFKSPEVPLPVSIPNANRPAIPAVTPVAQPAA
ncbi:MAG: hypothetical protein V4692_04630 [Bdellovibrionota bacterium]